MSFAMSYSRSVNTSSLRDDEHHDNCMPLGASGWAHREVSNLGMLLLRCQTADGVPNQIFESGARNIPAILKIWMPMVKAKGVARKWDIHAGDGFYQTLAESSLAYFLDPWCSPCGGTGQDADRRTCAHCKGVKVAPINMHQKMADITRDLVSELGDLLNSHVSRAKAAFRDAD
jgi:hypothetical protein